MYKGMLHEKGNIHISGRKVEIDGRGQPYTNKDHDYSMKGWTERVLKERFYSHANIDGWYNGMNALRFIDGVNQNHAKVPQNSTGVGIHIHPVW